MSASNHETMDFPLENASTVRALTENSSKSMLPVVHSSLYHATCRFIHSWFEGITKALEEASGYTYSVGKVKNIDSPIAIYQHGQRSPRPLIIAELCIEEERKIVFRKAKQWLQHRTKLVILVDIHEERLRSNNAGMSGKDHDFPSTLNYLDVRDNKVLTVHMSLWRLHLPPQCVFVGSVSPVTAGFELGESRSNGVSFMKSELVPGLCHFDDKPIVFPVKDFLMYLQGALRG